MTEDKKSELEECIELLDYYEEFMAEYHIIIDGLMYLLDHYQEKSIYTSWLDGVRKSHEHSLDYLKRLGALEDIADIDEPANDVSEKAL